MTTDRADMDTGDLNGEARPRAPLDGAEQFAERRVEEAHRGPSHRAGSSLRPSSDTIGTLLRAGARWSPAGLAALLVLVFWGIGGSDGAVKIAKAWRSSSDSQMAMARELAELTREVKALRAAITGAQATQQAARVNLAAVCDLASELNLGKPHDSWCSDDGRSIRFSGPPLGAAAPLHVTAFTWQKVDP